MTNEQLVQTINGLPFLKEIFYSVKQPSSSVKTDAVKVLVGMAAFVVVVAGIRSVSPIIDQLLMAIIVALTFSPLLLWITAKGKSHATAVTITLLVVTIVVLGVAGMFGVALTGLIKRLPEYATQFTVLKTGFEQYLNEKGIDSTIVLGAAPDPSQLLVIGERLLGSISHAMGATLIVLVIAALTLAEAPSLTKMFVRRNEHASLFMVKVYKVRTEVIRYIAMLGLMNLMIAAGNTIIFFILGTDYAIVWGVLSFFLAFVPYVGFLLYASVPAVLVLMEKGWIEALILVAILFVINFIVDNIVKPLFMKGGFDISLLLIVLSFIFWGYILGALGFILAVPLTMTAKILLLDEDVDVDVRMPGEEKLE